MWPAPFWARPAAAAPDSGRLPPWSRAERDPPPLRAPLLPLPFHPSKGNRSSRRKGGSSEGFFPYRGWTARPPIWKPTAGSRLTAGPILPETILPFSAGLQFYPPKSSGSSSCFLDASAASGMSASYRFGRLHTRNRAGQSVNRQLRLRIFLAKWALFRKSAHLSIG